MKIKYKYNRYQKEYIWEYEINIKELEKEISKKEMVKVLIID